MARGDRILASDYNNIRAKVAAILGTGSAQRGYGQSMFSSPVTTNEPGARGGHPITKAQWDALRIDITNIKVHQDGILPPIITLADRAVVEYGASHPNTNYNTIADQAVAARFNIATSQSVIATKATQTRTGSWSNQSQCTVTITFNGGYAVTDADGTTFTATAADHARHFFNSGGQIRFNSTRSGGSSTPQNNAWTNLLSSIGTQAFGAITPAITNFYSLTNSYQTFYQLGASTPYSNNFYRLEALCNNTGANNSTGTANQITFRITWADAFEPLGSSTPSEKEQVGGFPTYPNNTVGPTGFGPDQVDGTLTITVDEFKASGVLIQGGLFSIASADTYSISSITAT
jgi:hypothetical protein